MIVEKGGDGQREPRLDMMLPFRGTDLSARSIKSCFRSCMASDSEDDGLEELEFEADEDEDENENVLIDAQEEGTEDGDEVCKNVFVHLQQHRLLPPALLGILRRGRRGRRGRRR